MKISPDNTFESIPQVERIADLNNLLGKKTHFLFGPCQTGKTFLIRYTLKDIHVYDLLDRLAPRLPSTAVRQNARPLGVVKGSYTEMLYLPCRAGKHCRKAERPPFRVGRLHSSIYLALNRNPRRIAEEITPQDRIVVIDEIQCTLSL